MRRPKNLRAAVSAEGVRTAVDAYARTMELLAFWGGAVSGLTRSTRMRRVYSRRLRSWPGRRVCG